MKANALLAALLFLTPGAVFADDLREFKAPLTKPLELGLGVWYESLANPKSSPLPPRDYRKPVATKVDLDAISLVAVKEKTGSLDSLTDDPAFETLKAKLDVLEAELHGPLPQPSLDAE